jgi:hypothetical protein
LAAGLSFSATPAKATLPVMRTIKLAIKVFMADPQKWNLCQLELTFFQAMPKRAGGPRGARTSSGLICAGG